VRITREERLYTSHTGHSVKGNSIETASFFVLAFEEKRVEGPHIIVGFSPVLGFLGYILCLFMDGLRLFIYFIYCLHLNYFINFK
jgi:hypothetical protein